MGLFCRGKNKVWWISITENGKQIRQSTKTTDKSLAQKIHAKVQTQIAEGRWFKRLPGEKISLEELLKKYLEDYSELNKAHSSFVRDKSLANHLKRCLGNDIKLTQIFPRLVSEYKARRRKEGAKPKTVNSEMGLLSHAFNLAIREWEWVEVNPVSRVSKEKVYNEIERWLSHREEERLLKASPVWLQEIISLCHQYRTQAR